MAVVRQMMDYHSSKHILPPRDTTLPHYNTVDTEIAYCIRHVTNIPDSIFTGDVNAHSTLWYSHTDDHRGQLISDIISNLEHIILNTDTHTRVPHTTLYNRTAWHTIYTLNSDHIPIITTINTRTKYKLQQNRHKFTNYQRFPTFWHLRPLIYKCEPM